MPKKTTKGKVRTTMYLDPRTVTRIDRLADGAGVSRTAYVHAVLAKHLDETPKPSRAPVDLIFS